MEAAESCSEYLAFAFWPARPLICYGRSAAAYPNTQARKTVFQWWRDRHECGSMGARPAGVFFWAGRRSPAGFVTRQPSLPAMPAAGPRGAELSEPVARSRPWASGRGGSTELARARGGGRCAAALGETRPVPSGPARCSRDEQRVAEPIDPDVSPPPVGMARGRGVSRGAHRRAGATRVRLVLM